MTCTRLFVLGWGISPLEQHCALAQAPLKPVRPQTPPQSVSGDRALDELMALLAVGSVSSGMRAFLTSSLSEQHTPMPPDRCISVPCPESQCSGRFVSS